MKLKDQVCSLELAKKLKELGVKQESIWCYSDLGYGVDEWSIHEGFTIKRADYHCFCVAHLETGKEAVKQETRYSAFTVAELGEMLPLKIKSYRYFTDWEWRCVDEDDKRNASTQIDTKSEANARAKMLIYLKENKL